MKDVIKEKLLREIEDNLISENRTYDERDIKKAIEVTSMVEYEEFINILDELLSYLDLKIKLGKENLDKDNFKIHYNCCIDNKIKIKEIKQMFKGE